jgi:ribosomal protein L12E/L44/L45/RPP1/RPP2
MQMREQPDQPDSMSEAVPAGPQHSANQSAPVLDNAVRARLVAQATGQRPARSKLENLQLARESLNESNERAVAEALNIDPDSPRLRDRILTALEGLRRPGVSTFAGMTAAGAASQDAQAGQPQTQGEDDAGFERDLEEMRRMMSQIP